jgi:hypothetical protein
VERNNSPIVTNEDVNYDPKQTTDKVSPVMWTAGAEETESDKEFIPIHRNSSPDDAIQAIPHIIQRSASRSTHSHGITESRGSQERRLEKSPVDMHQTHLVHASGKLENTYLYLFAFITKKAKKKLHILFFTQISAGLKSMLTSTLLLKSN